LLNILNSNFVSHVSLMEIIAQKMKQQKAGTIATLSSVAGDRGKQSNYVYGAAKAGKTTFAAGLRNRLYEFGVHVITIKLGFVDTPMTKDFKKGALWAQSTPVAKTIVQSIDQKRDIVYIPFFWKWIMHIIKSIPEAIFKRLKL
ncbi:MAG: SDR family NAD(P)-dependent oxidoreductase, partial [Pseudobdellovibrionaceae bacterium]